MHMLFIYIDNTIIYIILPYFIYTCSTRYILYTICAIYVYYTDELKAFGISEEDLFRCRVTDKYKLFMKFQIQRARDYYNLAKKGMYLYSMIYIIK